MVSLLSLFDWFTPNPEMTSQKRCSRWAMPRLAELVNGTCMSTAPVNVFSVAHCHTTALRYKLKDELKLVENEAKAAHEGMWMYGDITEDPKEI